MTVVFLSLSFLVQPFHQALANEAEAEEAAPVAEDVQPQEEQEEEVEVAPEEEPEEAPVEEAAVTETETDTGSTDDVAEGEPLPEEAEDEGAETTDESSPAAEDPTDNASATSSDESAAESAADTSTSTDSTASSTSPANTPAATTTKPAATTTTPVATTTATSSETATSTDETGATGGGNEEGETGAETAPVEEESDEPETPPAPTPADTADTDDGSEPSRDAASESSVAEEVVAPVVTSGSVVETQYLVTDENYYQFSRQSCVPVGDGTYHCSLSTEPVIDAQAAVYADRDEDGDMEIFLRTAKGKIEQVTDNQLDDTSPHFDAVSMRIVWQRMIDGRYQVVEYDLETRKETQLTFSRTNNMEPKVSKEGIVWQAWDGNDWEIMFFDGTYTDQITNNNTQDVTPVIEDGYILWSILGGDSQEAKVYSLESGEMMTITGHEGGEISNPRFVLVYDTRFDNGDVVTQGFDPATGLSQPIAAKPAPEPVEIPDVDPIGEIRALIQNKSTQKEDGVKTVIDTGTGDGVGSIPTTTDTLNLNQLGDTPNDIELEVSVDTASDTPNFELDDFDLVITPTATSTSMPEYATIDRAVIEAANASTSSTTRRSI